MKNTTWIIALVFAGAILVIALSSWLSINIYKGFSHDPTRITSSQPTIEQLKKMSHLVSMRVSVGDVLTAEGHRYKGAWLIKGDALIAVDMSKAQVEILDRDQKLAKISLPAPQVIQPRVDHDRTQTWSVQSNSWTTMIMDGDPDKLRDEAMKMAQELVEVTVNKTDYLKEAQLRAEEVIKGFYKQFEWEIEVVWPAPTIKSVKVSK